MDSQVSYLIKALKQQGLTLALAESITCGLAAHKLSTCPGTSDVFAGAIVCYSPRVKNSMLGVSKKMIEAYTCESKEVTEAMVKHLPKVISADICAAVTGLASAGGSETKGKPVGTVFLSILYKKKVYNERRLFRGSPLEIKKKACSALFEFLLLTCEL